MKHHRISGIGFATLLSILACGKEEKKQEASVSESEKAKAAASEESRIRIGALDELNKEQYLLELKVKTAGDRLEKQGNKTKKKLKPEVASLEALQARISNRLEKLQNLSASAFSEESDAIRAQQDSLSRALLRLEKSMK